mmetsp:Transcript_22279/g.50921  ORF Transcript_22279/g.50921 Transcript_22279/m.50921 type:complete len:112 (-) Transcript_22279:116-451(-)
MRLGAALVPCLLALLPAPCLAADGDLSWGSELKPKSATGGLNTLMFSFSDDYPYACKCVPDKAAAPGNGVCAHDMKSPCKRLPGAAVRQHGGLSGLGMALALAALLLALRA